MVQVKHRRHWLAWIPAALVLACSVITAAGVSLIPMATGAPASDTDTVDVEGTVGATIAFGTMCGAPAGTLTFASNFTQGMSTDNLAPDCSIPWSTNDTGGSELLLRDNDGAVPFFCHSGNGCGSADDVIANVGAGPAALAADNFGIALESKSGTAVCSSGCAAAGFTEDGDNDVQDTDASYYPITNSNAKACGTSGPSGDAQCTFVVGGQAGATQTSGAYAGTILFTANGLTP